MDLQDAIEQYADMVMLGSEAVKRLVEQKPNCSRREELNELIAAIVVAAERLRSACGAA